MFMAVFQICTSKTAMPSALGKHIWLPIWGEMSTLVLAVKPAAATQFGNILKRSLASRAHASTVLFKVMSLLMLRGAKQSPLTPRAEMIQAANT